MQFLFEEFFKKIFKTVNSINILTIRILVKIIFFLIILIVLFKIITLIIDKQYIILIILLGFFVLGEFAHYIRKFRERKIEVKDSKNNKRNHGENNEKNN